MNFWYGYYNFCEKSCNDEVAIYSEENTKDLLGYFEITTKPALKRLLKYDLDKKEDKEYYTEIETFLNNNSDIYYSFIYPRDEEDILDQVKHFAPTNEKNHKPIYIDMWTKKSESLDVNGIKNCVKIFIKEFLNTAVTNVEILDIPSYEETKLSYEEDLSNMYPMNEKEIKVKRAKKIIKILEEGIVGFEWLIKLTRHSRLKQKHILNLKSIKETLVETKEEYFELLKNDNKE